ncbi:MAG: serine/threonine-protein kinase [Planctomycetota bacterium]
MDRNSFPDHRLLLLYEQYAKSDPDGSVRKFIDRQVQKIDDDLKIELIGLDIDIRLKLGDRLDLETYFDEYPLLESRIREVFAECIEEMANDFCPVTESLGPLPQEMEGYTIHEEIGRGGMGVVYSATQKSLQRKVAIKVLFFSREDISLEARSLASIDHPNICKVHDAGKLGELPFMCMQLVEGKSLASHLESGKSPVDPTIRFMSQLCSAMAEAHRQDIYHKDLKPANLIVNRREQPVITDFGLSVCKYELESERGLGQLGSPAYMAPELFDDPSASGPALDIYSAGAIMFEMLTGKRPFGGPVDYMIEQIRSDPPRRPRDYYPDIDPLLEEACLKALCKNPEGRFESMADFAHELESWLEKARAA